MLSVGQPSRTGYAAILALIGIGWGSTQPLGKIAASTGHAPFGLIFWQLVVCVAVLGVLTVLRGKRLPMTRRALEFYVVVAFLGTLIPNYTFYLSVARLPAGIMSIIIATIPLIAFPIALALGMDRFSMRRIVGIVLGLSGVLLIALPQASLPERAMVAFLPVAMIGPLFYALENTYVAARGTGGLDAIQAMFGASLAGLVFCGPIMLALGHWFPMPMPPGRAEWALIGSSALHALLYASFVWLAARAGSVFASQSAYFTTASGIVWAMVLLGESFSPWVWAAAGLMLGGLMLVNPRERGSA
ncbi:DMT family transporter [Rhodobacteraceae bacterium KMS-5]|uniref:DMT family transporter n=2 Tax=Tabrizicola oligotrophica TaxID=2710650 RepID=A0A6M0QUB0_9RHOB|nr:DMT family transporter [Tabrizicola oligotrophica]